MKKVFLFIALVSVFAACQPEDLKTIFKSENAQLTINVTSVINSINGADVTASATKEPFETTGNPDIPAGTATVKATYEGITGQTTVGYPHILADTEPVVLGAIVYIPGTLGNYTVDIEPVSGEEVEVGKYLLAEGYNHGYSHAGYDYWVENASDYTLFDTCTYDDIYTPEITSEKPEVYEKTFEELVNANFETTLVTVMASDMTETDVEHEFEVPAWSIYQVENTVYEMPVKFYVTATPDGNAPKVGVVKDGVQNVVGYFEGKVTYSSLADLLEEHPSHAGHSGAGHGHGSGSNAGGGLVPAE